MIRACFVRHRPYPRDARMDNQIQALQSHGHRVDVICTAQKGQPWVADENGIRIYRLPALQRHRGSKARYALEYATFWLTCLVALTVLQVRRGYDLVHVHSMPDFLVLAAVVPRLLGAKTVLDLRECTPEMYHCKFGLDMDSRAMRLLIGLEQTSIRFADLVLTCTDQMRARFIERGAASSKVAVMLNVANPDLFRDPVLLDPDACVNGPFRVVSHGTITERYGHEVLIRAMQLVSQETTQARLIILGDGNGQHELQNLTRQLGLQELVTFAGFVPDDELTRQLRGAHCGVVPMVRNAETNLIHTYKMVEYIALGIPVVASRTTALETYYGDECICFFESGNAADLAQALLGLRNDPARRARLARKALNTYQPLAAPAQQAHYLELVQALLAEPAAPGEKPSPNQALT